MGVLDILLSKKLITKDDYTEVKKQAASGRISLDKVLVARGVKPEDILAAKGESLNIPIRNLGDASIPFEVLEYIPQESAIHYKFAPISVKDNTLEVGIVDPDNIEARDALNFIASKKQYPVQNFPHYRRRFQARFGCLQRPFRGSVKCSEGA